MIIETERLTLRPLTMEDEPVIRELLDDPFIAAQLPAVRHPLPEDGAKRWIETATEDITFACIRRDDGALGGIVALHLEPGNRAQLGGWCGEGFRHEGYAVEAMHACVRYGYESLGLKMIYALRKGRLWIAPRDSENRHLPFKHEPSSWHLLDQIDEEGAADRNPAASIGQRLGRLFGRS